MSGAVGDGGPRAARRPPPPADSLLARAPGPHTTRRGFLRLASTSAAFAALANLRILPARGLAGAAAPARGRFFSPGESEILSRIVERVVDTGETGAPAVRETRAVATIDALCGVLDPALTRPLPTLLRLVEYGPVLFELKLGRFTGLEAAQQDAHLAGWLQSRFHWRRMGMLALRNLAFLGYYSQEESWPLIGYAGPLIPRPEGTA